MDGKTSCMTNYINTPYDHWKAICVHTSMATISRSLTAFSADRSSSILAFVFEWVFTIFFMSLAIDVCSSLSFVISYKKVKIVIHYIYFSYLNSWERASIFPIECSLLNKGTTGTIFITSLVWHGPWLEIKPGTSRTRSRHYTTRLLRRR